MKSATIYSHRCGKEEFNNRELYMWAQDIFDAPTVNIVRYGTTLIRAHVREALNLAGWSGEAKIDQRYKITVFSLYKDSAFELQTGNIGRAYSDLLKLQYLYTIGKINTAIYALPTKLAARVLGSNVANYERITGELQLFNRVISMPILVIGFE